MTVLRVAAVQMDSRPDLDTNLDTATRLVAAAVRDLGLPYHLVRDPRRPYGTVWASTAILGALLTLILIGGAPAFGGLNSELPSVLRVFRLYCVDGLSAERVARKCRCAKGTVMSRLRFIEAMTHTRPEQFRAMSSHLQQIDDDLRASGAREIYRRGLAQGDDE